jgi:hypothetical protein
MPRLSGSPVVVAVVVVSDGHGSIGWVEDVVGRGVLVAGGDDVGGKGGSRGGGEEVLVVGAVVVVVLVSVGLGHGPAETVTPPPDVVVGLCAAAAPARAIETIVATNAKETVRNALMVGDVHVALQSGCRTFRDSS